MFTDRNWIYQVGYTFGYIRLWTVTTVAFSKMTFIL